ncbi:MAG TPA: phage protein Gp27 family protein [Candidatus Binataceae bacterium]|nr:phage protein Gp27 family protein [Candidatus Binataceae bacterium]
MSGVASDSANNLAAPRKPGRKRRSAAEKFAEQLETVRLALAEARVIAKETAGDDDVMHRALARMVQSHLFEILRNLLDKTNKRGQKAPDIHAIARTLCTMNKQEIEMERWRIDARSRVGAGVDAAAARVEEARAEGLSPGAAEKIRSALLEIKL